MANEIKNRLEFIGDEEKVKEVMEFLRTGEQAIDFNNITPMPKWVYGSDPSVRTIGKEDEEKWGKENTSIFWATLLVYPS